MNVLVVDGYNIIGAWDELSSLKDKDMAQARDRLIEMMAEYRAYSGYRVIIVFDAYFVQGIANKKQKFKVEIIYTKEKETADDCIEKLAKSLKTVRNQVYVTTSDYDEQRTVFGQGALRISARELAIEMKNVQNGIKKDIERHQRIQPQFKIPIDEQMLEVFEKWRRGHR